MTDFQEISGFTVVIQDNFNNNISSRVKLENGRGIYYKWWAFDILLGRQKIGDLIGKEGSIKVDLLDDYTAIFLANSANSTEDYNDTKKKRKKKKAKPKADIIISSS